EKGTRKVPLFLGLSCVFVPMLLRHLITDIKEQRERRESFHDVDIDCARRSGAMMRWIIGWSLKFRLFVLALAVALMIVGITQLRDMPVDTLPEFAPPYVEVQTEALGLSAPEVEELVTVNREELLNGTPWLQTMRSTSVPGLSSITLIFQPGTDNI